MLDKDQLRALLPELSFHLVPGKVRRLRARSPHSVVLEIRSPGRTSRLLLSADPETGRVHLTSAWPPAAPEAPFVSLLRSELVASLLVGIDQPEGERALVLRFLQKGGKEPWNRALVLELFGRGADLRLLDETSGTLGSLRGLRRAVPLQIDYPSRLLESRLPPDLLSPEIEARYDAIETREARSAAWNDALIRIQKARASCTRRREKLLVELASVKKALGAQKEGEILAASYHLLRRGLDSIEVPDPFDPEGRSVVVRLDPSLEPRKNVENLFRRSRKARRALPLVQEKIRRCEDEVRELTRAEDGISRHLQQATEDDDRERLEAILSRLPPSRPRRGESGKKKPRAGKPGDAGAKDFSRFVSLDGVPLVVGKNDRANDRLVRTLARGEDYWLHARDVAGSHVLVRMARGADLKEETLLDAATLAAHFSKARGKDRVAVVYTRRKFLSKPRGARPGLVTYSKASYLDLDVDRKRLDRLLGRMDLESGRHGELGAACPSPTDPIPDPRRARPED